MSFGWKLHGDGRYLPEAEVVRPDERMSWPRTVGLGLNHVLAMLAATLLLPLLLGVNLGMTLISAGVATLLFLLIVRGKVPTFLGTSASFVAVIVALQTVGHSPSVAMGAVLVAGLAVFAVGAAVHVIGGHVIGVVFPPVVTGAIVMMIGLSMAPFIASRYWVQDQWVALITLVITLFFAGLFTGIISRFAIVLGVIIGVVLSVLFDKAEMITSVVPGQNLLGPDGAPCAVEGPFCHAVAFSHPRIAEGGWQAVRDAAWFGLPTHVTPSFQGVAILTVLPLVVVFLAENAAQVKAVGTLLDYRGGTGGTLYRPRRRRSLPLDPSIGRALMGNGVNAALAAAVGAPPNVTYSDNVRVMGDSRVYSTAPYYFASVFAIILGLCPKFSALLLMIPAGVIAGTATVVFGLLAVQGARIWSDNRVDFFSPVNVVPTGAGLLVALAGISIPLTSQIKLTPLAFGAALVVVLFHLFRVLLPKQGSANESMESAVDWQDTAPVAIVDLAAKERGATASSTQNWGTQASPQSLSSYTSISGSSSAR